MAAGHGPHGSHQEGLVVAYREVAEDRALHADGRVDQKGRAGGPEPPVDGCELVDESPVCSPNRRAVATLVGAEESGAPCRRALRDAERVVRPSRCTPGSWADRCCTASRSRPGSHSCRHRARGPSRRSTGSRRGRRTPRGLRDRRSPGVPPDAPQRRSGPVLHASNRTPPNSLYSSERCTPWSPVIPLPALGRHPVGVPVPVTRVGKTHGHDLCPDVGLRADSGGRDSAADRRGQGCRGRPAGVDGRAAGLRHQDRWPRFGRAGTGPGHLVRRSSSSPSSTTPSSASGWPTSRATCTPASRRCSGSSTGTH